MTKITIKVAKPAEKITESVLWTAFNSTATGAAEKGIIPINATELNVEFKSKNAGLAWDSYHAFRKNYPASIFSCDVSTGKNTVRLFERN